MRTFAEQMGWVADRGGFAIDAAVDERLGFLRKTYALLTMQIALVGGLVSLLIQNEELLVQVTRVLFGNILVYLAILFGVSLLTRSMLRGDRSLGVQSAAAGIWVVFLAALTAPMCYFARQATGSFAIVGQAFVLTISIFGALTTYVLTTRKDFSFLRGALWIGSVAMLAIVLIFSFAGFAGRAWIPFAYVALLGGWTLYDTSQVLHRRPVSQAVAASVDLLVDFVFMFIYVLMILLNSQRR
jgi:FtsH-binding integral membrane protein